MKNFISCFPILKSRQLNAIAVTFAMFCGLMAIASCSANWHIKQAVKKGAKVTQDTVYVTLTTERTITDTVTQYVNLYDTIKTETVKWKSVLKVDTVTNTIYQQVECLPDTIKVPVYVNSELKPDKDRTARIIIYMLIGAVIVLLLLAFLKR